MPPVHFGIIGLGYWGPNLLRNFAAEPQAVVKWGCDLDEKNLMKAKRHLPALQTTTRVEDILADPAVDCVAIATPTTTHYALAKAVLQAGKHVLVEKPITSSVQEAEELCTTAKKYGKFLFVDHTFVYAPAVQCIADAVEKKQLGELLYFDSVRINLGLIQKDCNVLWDLAIHDLSILSTFCQLEDVEEVAAHGNRHFGTQIENAHLHLRFKNNFATHIHVSWLSPVKLRQSILGGTKAMITFDDIHPSEKVRIYDKGIDRDITKPDPFFPKYRAGEVRIPPLPAGEPLAREAAHIIACVQGKEKPMVPGESGLQIIRILDAADRSLAQGSTPIRL